jgi:hypothetical protein
MERMNFTSEDCNIYIREHFYFHMDEKFNRMIDENKFKYQNIPFDVLLDFMD